MRTSLFFVCFFAILMGCDNSDLKDNSDILGQYSMTMMDGMTVPDIFTDSGGNELVLAGGELVVRDDGRYFLEISIVVNNVDESVNVSGDYSLSGNTLMLEGGISGSYDGEDEVDVTYPISGISHVFKYDKSSVFEQ